MATVQTSPVRTMPSPPKFHVISEYDAQTLRAPIQRKPKVDQSKGDGDGCPKRSVLIYTCSVRRRGECKDDS